VFDRPPEPLDHYVVYPTSLAIHANGNAIRFELQDPFIRGEMAALVSVEYLRRPMLYHCTLETPKAEFRIQRGRDLPIQYLS